MSIYIFLYFTVICFLVYVGGVFYSKYKNIGGFGFLLFTIFTSARFVLFFLSFFIVKDTDILLQISRFAYGTSLLAIYSFLLFLFYFGKVKKNVKIDFGIKIIIFLILGLSFLTYFSPYIIESMYFNVDKKDYYEVFGPLYYFYLLVQLLFFPIFSYLVFIKYKTLRNINKIRLKYILLGSFLFILLALIFQLILPSLKIYILEKESILFIIPFVFFSRYSITRYYFIDVSFRYKEILSFLLSILLTVFLFIYIKNFTAYLGKDFINYWGIKNIFTYMDLVFGIIIYLFFYKIFIYLLPGNSEYNKLILILNKFKEKIPFITNLYELNEFLSKSVKSEFGVDYVKIKILNYDKNKQKEIYKFFIKDFVNRDAFVNDIIFIEENKNKFNKEILINEIDKQVALIFPMFDNSRNLIGIFELGYKPFREQYYLEEIKLIKDFVEFLVGHIKYINIYSRINDLNINLDKKVDEKTIQYNNLISKQREFISMSSHEIKTPVMASSLQIESIIDDWNSGNNSKDYIKKELELLKEQIFKVSDLVKNIFSAQKYDIKNVGLYIEKVKLKNLIIGEIDVLQRIHPGIDFVLEISDDVGFVDIDNVQFTQVISNLLNNAVKFFYNNNPVIKTSVLLDEGDCVRIFIEDNGSGFNPGEENTIFEKYSTGKGKSVGIGMGLYLCKKIVELHGGNISAGKSINLGGAKFVINIPKNQKNN